ncbi:hypothetical protein SPRG_09923 [Saprolegnia parasitica CBS 223.65]|uniref:Homeobox domain-containing protein n=1 Tax=Saprolegnia parasitica (strain CBS 223.65) TaxID=695850 RepID=A0A067CCM6_SAPPC|nr:hypothetical protein SPRG_09923 [Saprolegnia parasitica CBS 223.65]KDO24286.1 hypothetical protein SPRG_09923 [Saprolegnia parasitica CBS 223.65]|eukprot:XP_012205057.1 hypothetical protein SPRG_09923 [Saprolegnia parasitica CBS 223.65]
MTTTTTLTEEQKQAAASPHVKDEVGHDDDDGGSSDEKDHDENTAPGDTWMLSPEHVKHPYPTDEDKKMLLEKTGINMKQLTNWFTNARKRIWKPMMRREHSRQLQSSFARDVQMRESGPRMPPPPFVHDRPTDDMRDGHAPLRMAHHGGHAPDHPFSHPNDPYQGYPPPTEHRSVGCPSTPASFFEPRSHRSVSESVVDRLHHHPQHHHQRVHHPYAAPHHPIPSSFLRLPPRTERSASDVSQQKLSPPLKRELESKDDDSNGKEKRARRSSLLPPHVIRILKDWMLSPEHLEHPYPTDVEKKALCDETGLDMCQLNNWFANNRKRLWKPTMANRSKERLQLYSNESIRSIIYNGKSASTVADLPALVPPPRSAPCLPSDILNASNDRAPFVLPPLSRPAASNSVGHEDHLPPLM